MKRSKLIFLVAKSRIQGNYHSIKMLGNYLEHIKYGVNEYFYNE